ncbi:C40 family peptidase [Clostridium estertheticum]|uniref:NlpC/P60 family protein n=1 Tax=Clostridium estertheticum TaxID=238834 RepID=UPI001CCEBBE6|nr:NlpC/P60 family protein [Clostridium estertheticum]MBZ9609294.1 C40 family peptidase [Clostridium estertheticum]
MRMTFKGAKIVINIFSAIVLFLFVFIILTPTHNPVRSSTSLSNIPKISPFSLKDSDIVYNAKADSDIPKVKGESKSDDLKIESLNKAKAMTEVKWIPKRNMVDKSCSYTFIKGKVYQGVPYSMDPYQVSSPSDFLNKINKNKGLYGNDCSGLVSAAWGIKRQTTLTLYDEVKRTSKTGKKFVSQISWDDLKPADALLLDNGSGKGHIMLYIDSDKKNSDNLNVYEQNIPTVTPYEPIPVARKDVRSKSKLMKKGYIPIRLMGPV